jgi:hypothetical protein
VHQRLDAEILKNVYSHSSTILFVERANAYFPIIEPILKEEGVPDDLKYLAVAESGLAPVTSSADARGVWQFMKATAGSFNLEVSEDVDERYHVEKATRAACKYLKKEKQKLGSWVLAMAAYNGGSTRISNDQMASQRAKSFFDLNLMADETMRYPFRIMAIKEVMENLEEYDYEIDQDHLYEPITDYQLVEVSGPVASWGAFAEEHGVSYRQLKVYNPLAGKRKACQQGGQNLHNQTSCGVMIMGKSGFVFLMNLLFAVTVSRAQHFSVQIAAYSEQQPRAFFEERGVTSYSERRDISVFTGIRLANMPPEKKRKPYNRR